MRHTADADNVAAGRVVAKFAGAGQALDHAQARHLDFGGSSLHFALQLRGISRQVILVGLDDQHIPQAREAVRSDRPAWPGNPSLPIPGPTTSWTESGGGGQNQHRN